MKNSWINVLLLAAFAASLFLFGLGKMALTDPDEPFYAQTAKEMLDRGDWLTPRIFGEPQFEKPALYYWLVIASFKLFGVNEFAARFPSAIFGILGVIGVYLLGKLLFFKRGAFYAALIMATAVEYVVLSRACITDMVLTVFILYGFIFYFYAYAKFHKKFFYILSCAFFALAVLTKGPVGLVLPAAIIFIYLWINKDLGSLKNFPFFRGAVVFLAIAAPWYYLVYQTFGNEFLGHFFGFQNVTRYLSPEHKIGDVIYYYLPIILGGFFPWSIFLPAAVYYLKKNDRAKKAQRSFLYVFVVVFFIFFSLSRTKLPTYVFPLFPALAILIGRYFELNFNEKRMNSGFMASGLALTLLMPAAIIVFYLFAKTKYPEMAPLALSSMPLVFGVSCLMFFSIVSGRMKMFFASTVLCVCVCLYASVAYFSDTISLYESSKYAAEEISRLAKPGDRIGAETDYRRGVAFYLGREDVVDIHNHDIVTKLLASNQTVWGVLKNKNHVQLYTNEKMPFYTPTYVLYTFGKKVILTNKMPESGKYLKKRSMDDPA